MHDVHWHVQGEKNLVVPEDIGKQAAYALLEEVQRGGVCDSMHQVSLPAPYSLSMCLFWYSLLLAPGSALHAMSEPTIEILLLQAFSC